MRRLIEYIKKAFAPAEGYPQLIKQRDDLLSERTQLMEENATLKARITSNFVRDGNTLSRLRSRLGKAVRRADSLGALLNQIQTLINEYGASINAQESENEASEEPWSCPDHPGGPLQLVLTGFDGGITLSSWRCLTCDRRSTYEEAPCTSHAIPKP
jgi:hypothetical protein